MPAMFDGSSGGGSLRKPTPRGAPSGHPTQRKKPKPSGHPTQRIRTPNVSTKPRTTPRPRTYSRMSDGGGYGGGSGSNSGGSVSAIQSLAPPDINTFLGQDDTYQSQMAAIAKALTNYKTQMGERQTEYNADFTNRLNELGQTEKRQTTEQADDYAGRGLYISGLYGKARGDLEQDFNRRETDMNTAKTSFMNGLSRDLLNFQEENTLSGQKARQEALNRRALQYSI